MHNERFDGEERNKYNMEGATDKVCRLLFLSKYL